MKRLFAKRIMLYFIVATSLSACVSVQKLNIQVATPPQIAIPDDIQSLLLLNGSITPNFVNYDRDSLEALLIKKKLTLDTLLRDSIAADTILQSAAAEMFESGRFDVVIPLEHDIDHSNVPGNLKRKLSPEEVTQLCKDFKTDALLLLNNFDEKLKTKFKGSYSGLFVEGIEMVEFVGIIEVSYKTEWFLLKPNSNEEFKRIEINDTINWSYNSMDIEDLYKTLPSVKEALIGGGIAAGNSLAAKIAPIWNNDVRSYFLTGNKEADAAVQLIKENKWEEAAGIWRKFKDSSSSSMRSKIEFNLALAAEMTGNIDEAIEWGIKSYKTKYSNEAERYLRVLDKRSKILKK